MGSGEELDAVVERLRGDPAITVLTGAGISAASGVPTFRGDDGLWQEFDPQELASLQGFRKDPERVWRWYDERRQSIAEVEPNPGHEVLAEWSHEFDRFNLLTQNVDDLHERPGTKNIVKLHGSIWHVSCGKNCETSPDRWEYRAVPLETIPPRCPHCEGLLRPEVVWFGESLDSEVLNTARRATNCDLFLTVGTSAEVHPAAGFIGESSRQGALTVEINPEATAATSTVDHVISEPAEEALPRLNDLSKNKER